MQIQGNWLKRDILYGEFCIHDIVLFGRLFSGYLEHNFMVGEFLMKTTVKYNGKMNNIIF
jgi:hypothetical protein